MALTANRLMEFIGEPKTGSITMKKNNTYYNGAILAKREASTVDTAVPMSNPSTSADSVFRGLKKGYLKLSSTDANTEDAVYIEGITSFKTDSVTDAHIGQPAWADDDETVYSADDADNDRICIGRFWKKKGPNEYWVWFSAFEVLS